MNKLVSKNPVQRFKQGRKIVKAQWGLKTRDDGVIVNSAGIPVGKSIMESSYNYEKNFPEDKLILPGLYQDPEDKGIYSPNNMDSNGNYNQVISRPSPIQNGTYYETKDASGKIIDRGRYFGGKKHSLPIGPKSKKSSQNNFNQKTINTPNQKTANNGQSTYKINKLNRKISNPGAYHNITIWQNKLKDFYAPGTFKVDGIWGKNTEAAYQKYLLDQSNKKVLDSLSSTTSLNFSNPIIENPSNINIQVPKQTYNRTQIREFLRNKGVNPYQFNGEQRKALRMVMNGTATDEDRALVQSMGIFKQGGNILPSRNIIERFKVAKAQKGLKTAPKAEDRYAEGYNYSQPYMKVVRGKSSGLTHGANIYQFVKELTPYYNDTTYVEIPEHTSFVNVKPRVAKTNSIEDLNSPILDKNGWPTGYYKFKFNNSPEYEILKRRFNTAWNLAK